MGRPHARPGARPLGESVSAPDDAWAIYESPEGYRGMFVARRWFIVGTHKLRASEFIIATSLDEVRDKLPPGLTRLSPDAGTESEIVEIWI